MSLIIRGLLTTLPAHTVFRVFENDAAVGEFTANLIGATKIATASCFLSIIY